jgi:iron complex outermembrane receptor protein
MMKKLFMLIFSTVLCLGLLIGDPSSLLAQGQSSDEFTLEEITVTAQKREENQQKVAVAMEVFAGQDLQEMAKTDIDQILSGTSTAFINRTEEGLRVQLRGVGFDTPAGYGFGAGTVPGTVSVNLDGIYTSRRPTGTNLYDIERVEVLFGPQSTTYASNAPGGIVNVNTARPKIDTYEASGTLEYGSYNLLHTEGVLNVPIGKTFALRAGFNTNVRDGYLSNGGDNEDSKQARLRGLWTPNEKLSILVTGEYQVSTTRGMSSTRGFIDQDDVEDPWYTDAEFTNTPSKQPQTKINGQIDYNFDFATLTIIPARSDEDYDQTTTGTDFMTGAAFTGYVTGSGYENGIEARMTSSSASKLKWILGYNYYKSELIRESYSDYSTGQSSQTEFKNLLQQEAILGNVTFPVTDQFRMVAGARYSKDRAMSAQTPIVPLTPFDRQTYSDMTQENPDWKLGIEYDLSGSSMFFANWSTSYRVEQEAMNWEMEAFDPQEMTAYQAGYKSRLFENTLQLNLSGYYYDYKNRIFMAMEQTYIPPGGGPPGPYVEGATPGPPDQGGRAPGNMRMYGADLQTTTILSPNDKLDISVSYLNSWITSLFFDYQYLPDKDYSNREPTSSPDWTINLGYSHNFTFSDGSVLTPKLDARYQSKYIIEWKDASMGKSYIGYRDQEAHIMADFGLVYGSSDGKWTVTGYVKNLTNYAEKRFMNAMGGVGAVPDMNISPPRTYGGVLSVRF